MNTPAGAPVDQEKKVKIAKEKKEQADKAFQTSDLPTGTSAISFHFIFMCGVAQRALDSFEVLS